MATLAEMRARVAEQIGNKAGINSTIDFNLNQATLQLVKELRPDEMVTTVTFTTINAQAAYTLTAIAATDLYGIIIVREGSVLQHPMKQGSIFEFESRDQTATGVPSKWTRRGNSIILYDQIPDDNGGSNYSVRLTYLKRPATMTAMVDFPLNDEWIKPVEDLASAMLFAHLNQYDKAAGKAAVYDQTIAKMDTPKMIQEESPETGVVMVTNILDNF